MRRITQTLIAIFLWCAFMLGACSRQTTDQTPEQYQINQLQEWLQRNGGIFRQGTITAKNPDDHLVTGQLAWQQRKEIAYNGERFIQIPFIFGGSRASLPGNEKIAPVRFDLIMQVEAGIPVKAAVRTTMIGATVDRSNGRKEKGYLQAYHWLSGAPAYAWLTTLDLTSRKDFTNTISLRKELYL